MHVWSVSLVASDGEVSRARSLLSAEERNRAERFRFERHRRRFTVARAVLRRLIGDYLRVPPETVKFGASQHGKPFLRNPPAGGLHFNSADSDDVALIAVALGRDVGVDVERIAPERAGLEIADRFFSTDESRRLRDLPAEARVPAFFACWTRKEAYLKAIGTGLLAPLDGFSVSFEPGVPARLVSVQGDAEAPAMWSLVDLRPKPGYRAAVAIKCPSPDLRCWSWPPTGIGTF
ncbi:MAG: 4'-phosphopantetheinyl transferase superfamily protein [Gemmatimonadota bacterium]